MSMEPLQHALTLGAWSLAAAFGRLHDDDLCDWIVMGYVADGQPNAPHTLQLIAEGHHIVEALGALQQQSGTRSSPGM